MAAVQETVDRVRRIDVDEYKYGFVTDIESDKAPKGLDEDTVRFISAKKSEPDWMLEWRLEAFRRWLTMGEPNWARVEYPKIDYQDLYYYAAPKQQAGPKSLDEVDPGTVEDLRQARHSAASSRRFWPASSGRRGRVAVDAVFDSVSVATTFKAELAKAGVIFCSILGGGARAPRTGAEISRLGGAADRQFLRDAEFGGVLRRLLRLRAAGRALPDGAFDLFPHQREEHRPVRAHADHRRQGRLCQLSRGLHGAASATRTSFTPRWSNSSRSTTPRSNIRRCRTGIPAMPKGKGGIYNFVTKRGDCRGARAKISWTQVETGSAITWKYPSCILRGDESRGEFYSIAISNGRQQVDSGTKMIHLGKRHDEPHHLQGHRAGQLAEHLSRPGLGASPRRPARAISPIATRC